MRLRPREHLFHRLVILGAIALSVACWGCLDDFAKFRHRYEAAEHEPREPRERRSEAPEEDAKPAGALGSGRRVYAKARFAWIRKNPSEASEWLGFISLGESVELRREAHVLDSATGCAEWVPVMPQGWVCVGSFATLDPTDQVVRTLAEHAINLKSAWPYDYARSLGAPRYRGVPSERDQRSTEGDIDLLRKRIDRARLVSATPGGEASVRAIDPRLVGVELGMTNNEPPAAFEPPSSILESNADISFGSTIAYSYEFDLDGRAWLLTWDHAAVPQIRVKKYPRSAFRGVVFDALPARREAFLPIAFTRKSPAHFYRRSPDGAVRKEVETFPAQSPIELAGTESIKGLDQDVFRATRTDPTLLVRERDVVLISPIGQPPRGLPTSGRRTWVEVSTVGGWLVAFEGTTPVFATLISAGRARMLSETEMAPASSTPNGTYTVLTKMITANMRSESRPNAEHAEVMYTQVFHESFALHGAYWHDEWGDRRSAGCVNLSPIDAKWLFEWSEPAMSPDWHARRTLPGDPVTWVVVHS